MRFLAIRGLAEEASRKYFALNNKVGEDSQFTKKGVQCNSSRVSISPRIGSKVNMAIKRLHIALEL